MHTPDKQIYRRLVPVTEKAKETLTMHGLLTKPTQNSKYEKYNMFISYRFCYLWM